MKKIIILALFFFSLSSASFGKSTTFTNEVFKDAQISGKTVVINSWNKTCGTCAKQVIISVSYTHLTLPTKRIV